MWAQHEQWFKLGQCVEFLAGDFFKAGEEEDVRQVFACAGCVCQHARHNSHMVLHAETLPVARDDDVYVLRLILHDWNDHDSITILSNIRKAMGSARTKLVIVEV
jgi:hypothetical protein